MSNPIPTNYDMTFGSACDTLNMTEADLIYHIERACLIINTYVSSDDLSFANEINGKNSSGDDVKKLDKITGNIFGSIIKHECPIVYGIISEEHDEIYKTGNDDGQYIIAFDPLDGSSNIEYNVTIGTIFAVYKVDDSKKIKSGNDIVMAGYCLYSSRTQFVYGYQGEIMMKQLSTSSDVFYTMDAKKIELPPTGIYYSVNQSNQNKWLMSGSLKNYISELSDKGYSLRYVGSLVADFHRLLLSGGVFMYPADDQKPTGKIRLYYEAYPVAFLTKIAGGYTTNFKTPILDIEAPDNIHQTVPIMIAGQTEMFCWQKHIDPKN